MKVKKRLLYLFMLIVLLAACTPPPMQDPSLIYTVVASTQTAAAWQTQMAEASFSKTPTQATLRPTFTPLPTMTSFVYQITASPTLTPTASATSTPPILTSWPDWKTGEVVVMPKGSGENIGTNKRFEVLVGVQVLVTRPHGVKIRAIPNKAMDGPMEEEGSVLTLTGIMNKNNEFGWLFVQVKAVNGQTYWVGGTDGENTDPRRSFEFYYPHLTTSPTPSPSATATASPTSFNTPTETATETMSPYEETLTPTP